MSVTAIISEYNPFHNGHAYQLNEAREITGCDSIVAIMSGNFVQRGEPAIIDKYTRAHIALLNGVDVCLQIPTFATMCSAQHYAFTSVYILNKLNIADNLCFGCECGDINVIKDVAAILVNEPEQYTYLLRKELKNGHSYAASVSIALSRYCNDSYISEVLEGPNNVLAIEYVKSLLYLNSQITPVAIKRIGANHNSTKPDNATNTASASYIRSNVMNYDNYRQLISEASFDLLKSKIESNSIMYTDDFSMIFNYILCCHDKDYFKRYYGVNDVIASKLMNERFNNTLISNHISNMKTKNTSYTQLSRACFSVLTGFDLKLYNHCRKNVPFVRLLGLNKRHSGVLKQARDNTSIQLLSKWSSFKPQRRWHETLYTYEINCDNIYMNVLSGKNNLSYKNEITCNSIII